MCLLVLLAHLTLFHFAPSRMNSVLVRFGLEAIVRTHWADSRLSSEETQLKYRHVWVIDISSESVFFFLVSWLESVRSVRIWSVANTWSPGYGPRASPNYLLLFLLVLTFQLGTALCMLWSCVAVPVNVQEHQYAKKSTMRLEGYVGVGHEYGKQKQLAVL